MTIAIRKTASLPDKKSLDAGTNWIIFVPAGQKSSFWKTLPYGEFIYQRRQSLGMKDDDDKSIEFDLDNKIHSHVTHVVIDENISSFKLLGLARDLVKSHLGFNSRTLSCAGYGFEQSLLDKILEAIVSAALAATAEMPQFKKEKSGSKKLSTIKLFVCKDAKMIRRAEAESEGNTLARQLSMLPSNKLTPGDYLKKIKILAREQKWNLQFYGVNELKKKKAGAFLAVAQGSPTNDAGIVKLIYKPAKASRKKLSLVGKGICYDTGGTNLKPAKYMFGMHEDMQGSAVALGTFLALSKLNVPFQMECWLALAMNHIGPKAYKPNDVVTAADGTNIEVVHTDAEGRMVLADTLLMASATKPDLIIDYATLTGACVYSLGTAYSGVFSNREEYWMKMIEAGKDSGERVWPFPLDEDYDEGIKSDIADVKQCSMEGNADHILASRFLKRFVKNDTPWIHVDLSSSSQKGGLAHIPTDTTGFGIRFTLNLLLNKKII